MYEGAATPSSSALVSSCKRGLPGCQTDKRWLVAFVAIEFVVDQSTDERPDNRGWLARLLCLDLCNLHTSVLTQFSVDVAPSKEEACSASAAARPPSRSSGASTGGRRGRSATGHRPAQLEPARELIPAQDSLLPRPITDTHKCNSIVLRAQIDSSPGNPPLLVLPWNSA